MKSIVKTKKTKGLDNEKAVERTVVKGQGNLFCSLKKIIRKFLNLISKILDDYYQIKRDNQYQWFC